jgi:hypothetical protein
MAGNNSGSYLHFVNATAVADTPSVNASDVITLNEGASVPLVIDPGSSSDNLDNSEFLSVRITVPFDMGINDYIGDLTTTLNATGVTFTQTLPGVWTVTATGNTSAAREAALSQR